ncbi:hypothetical protein HAX54_011511 [Datura stramonium]|uniref:Uncharacterized protein n=1 Tax=Datura stramonium TaxID=4076 RepID=A0ABS8TJZ2_DATST|nr:hypothetical protein [Datura stramonium]
MRSTRNQLEQIRSSIQELRAVAFELDVSANGPAIEAAVQKAWDAFGHIDVLVNNAGIRAHQLWPATPQLVTLMTVSWKPIVSFLIRSYPFLPFSNWLCVDIKLSVASYRQGAFSTGFVRGGMGEDLQNEPQRIVGSLAYASSKDALNSMTR